MVAWAGAVQEELGEIGGGEGTHGRGGEGQGGRFSWCPGGWSWRSTDLGVDVQDFFAASDDGHLPRVEGLSARRSWATRRLRSHQAPLIGLGVTTWMERWWQIEADETIRAAGP